MRGLITSVLVIGVAFAIYKQSVLKSVKTDATTPRSILPSLNQPVTTKVRNENKQTERNWLQTINHPLKLGDPVNRSWWNCVQVLPFALKVSGSIPPGGSIQDCVIYDLKSSKVMTGYRFALFTSSTYSGLPDITVNISVSDDGSNWRDCVVEIQGGDNLTSRQGTLTGFKGRYIKFQGEITLPNQLPDGTIWLGLFDPQLYANY